MAETNCSTECPNGETSGSLWQQTYGVLSSQRERDPGISERQVRWCGPWAVPARALPAIPGAIVSFLPVGICPVCWPAYAGLLSSFGLGFLLETAYLLPLTVVFLALAVAGLGYRAKTRRGFGPLALGLVASLMIVVGKFAAAIDPVAHLGIGLLISAGLWNAWPKRVGKNTNCPACIANPNP